VGGVVIQEAAEFSHQVVNPSIPFCGGIVCPEKRPGHKNQRKKEHVNAQPFH